MRTSYLMICLGVLSGIGLAVSSPRSDGQPRVSHKAASQHAPRPAAHHKGKMLQVSISGQGSVSSFQNQINCGTRNSGTCKAWFNKGEYVDLSVIPATGWILTHWQGGPCKGMGPCQLHMDRAYHIRVRFILRPQPRFAVNIYSLSDGGSVLVRPHAGSPGLAQACGRHCYQQLTFGSVLDARPVAKRGYRFSRWVGCNHPHDLITYDKHCFIDVDGERSLRAVFLPTKQHPHIE